MKDKINVDFEKSIIEKAKSRDMYKIVFTDSNDKDIEYEIVATFKNNTNKKLYYLLTDNTRTNKELNIFAYYTNYEDEVEDNLFYPVVEEEELNMVKEVFEKIKADL